MFDFIYPHNSYLFSGIPQINVADNKNKRLSLIVRVNVVLNRTVVVYVPTLENQSPIRKQK